MPITTIHHKNNYLIVETKGLYNNKELGFKFKVKKDLKPALIPDSQGQGFIKNLDPNADFDGSEMYFQGKQGLRFVELLLELADHK